MYVNKQDSDSVLEGNRMHTHIITKLARRIASLTVNMRYCKRNVAIHVAKCVTVHTTQQVLECAFSFTPSARTNVEPSCDTVILMWAPVNRGTPYY